MKLAHITAAGALTILNLHRVDDDRTSAYPAMDPALFDELVGWLKRHFRIMTFAELGEFAPGAKPPLILSFDDGYKDFIEKAAPVLGKHGVKANQNIIPGCVERRRPPMNVIVQDFIGSAPAALLKEISFPGLSNAIDPDDRPASGMRASAALKSRPIVEQRALFADLEAQFARFDTFRTTPMMTVDDIREIAEEHEVGVHSFEHASMSAESDHYLADDAARCRAWFSQMLAGRPRVYAFPNGAARQGQAEIVRQAGFEHVLLVGEMFSQSERWLHPRFTMYAANAAEARFRAMGGLKPVPAGRAANRSSSYVR